MAEPGRLGTCEVCNGLSAKYTCPRCELKTCGLKCVNIHKIELNCSGIRCPTDFKPIKDMTELDLQKDYTFLQDCSRFVNSIKSDNLQYEKLSMRKYELKTVAYERKINLKYLNEKTNKHKQNTTTYDKNTNTIFWKLQWIFPNADGFNFFEPNCSEQYKLSTLVHNCLYDNSLDESSNEKLKYYQSKGIGQIKIFMRSGENYDGSQQYFELDIRKTLLVNLMNKTIIEYPSLYVVIDESEHILLFQGINDYIPFKKCKTEDQVTVNMEELQISAKLPKMECGQNLLFPNEDEHSDG